MSRSSMALTALVVMVPYYLLVKSCNDSAAQAAVQAAGLAKGTMTPDLAAQIAALKAQAGWHRQVVYLVNMSLMGLGLYVGLGPLLGSALDAGIGEVSEQLEVAERRSAKAKGELVDANERLGRIDADVDALRKRERAAAHTEATRLAEFAAKESTQIAQHAELSVQREVKDVRNELLAKVAGRAVEAALDGIEGELDPAAREHIHRVMVQGMGR